MLGALLATVPTWRSPVQDDLPCLPWGEKISDAKWDDEVHTALAGNRTPIDCLEGNHANHYTTNAYIKPLAEAGAESSRNHRTAPHVGSLDWREEE